MSESKTKPLLLFQDDNYDITLDYEARGNKNNPWKLNIDHYQDGQLISFALTRREFSRIAGKINNFLEKQFKERLILKE
jgi:hypothetical protein